MMAFKFKKRENENVESLEMRGLRGRGESNESKGKGC